MFSEYFTVKSSISQTYPTGFTPRLESLAVGKPHSYKTGYVTETIMEVTPENASLPITEIVFRGYTKADAGDYSYIKALIPRCEEKRVSNPSTASMIGNQEIFYLDRQYTQRETAIEIAILTPKKEILKIDRSADYLDYKTK